MTFSSNATATAGAASTATPDAFDSGPLSWVMGEIRETLGRSSTALLQAAALPLDEAPADPAPGQVSRETLLRQAKAQLHQAHGALQVVNVDGVALLTETTEDLYDRLAAAQLQLTPQIVIAIEQACGALTDYLDELLGGAEPQPVRLFPYYRALLEVRGAERIHPADLFFPNLAIRPTLAAPADAALAAALDPVALRKRFEKGLLPFLKGAVGPDASQAIEAMRSVVAEVEQAQTSQQARSFWWVMRGFADAVAAGQIENELFVKQLFARINLQIRRMGEGSGGITERLLRDALFFIARVAAPSPQLRQIRDAYRLDGQVPTDFDTRRYGRIDGAALATARARLNHAKTFWNRIVGGDHSVAGAFEAEMQALCDAGAKLDTPALTKLLRELNGLARAAASAKPGDRLGLEMATCLLFVEHALGQIGRLDARFAERADAMTARLLSIVAGEDVDAGTPWLDDMSRQAQQRQTIAALTGELQSSLRQVEKTLEEYFARPGDVAVLVPVIGMLHQVSGALAVLDQNEATRATGHVQQSLQRMIDAGVAPDPALSQPQFQQIARNIGALGFFIDALQLGGERQRQRFVFDDRSGLFQEVPAERAQPVPVEVLPLEPIVPVVPVELAASAAAIVTLAPEQALSLMPATEADAKAEPQEITEADTEASPEGAAETAIPLEATDAPDALQFAATAVAAAPEVPDISLSSADLPTVEQDLQQHQQAAVHAAQALCANAASAADHGLATALRDALEQVRRDASLIDHPEAGVRAGAALALLGQADFATTPQLQAALLAELSPAAALPAPVLPVAVPAPESEEAVDAELLEIFLTEAVEVLEAVHTALPLAQAAPHEQEHLTTLRRAFHTLKGSGRMVGLMAFGEAAWSIEQVLNQRLSESRGGDPELIALLGMAHDILGRWVADLQREGRSSQSPQPLIAAAGRLQAGLPVLQESQPDIFAVADDATSAEPEELLMSDDEMRMFGHAADADAPADTIVDIDAGTDTDIDTGTVDNAGNFIDTETGTNLDAAELPATKDTFAEAFLTELPEAPAETRADVIEFPTLQAPAPRRNDSVRQIGSLEIGVALHNIYLTETDELVRLLSHDFDEWRHEPERHVNTTAVNAAHSLAGTSATVGFRPLQEIAHALEAVLQQLAREPTRLLDRERDTLDLVMERVRFMLRLFALGEMADQEPAQVRALQALLEAVTARGDTSAAVDEWLAPAPVFAADPVAPVDTDNAVESNDATELADATGSSDATEWAESTDSPESPQAAERTEATALAPATEAAELAGDTEFADAAEFTDATESGDATDPAVTVHSAIDPALDQPPVIAAVMAQAFASSAELPEAAPLSVMQIKDELDPDLLPVFTEEASDMLPQVGQLLRHWQQTPGDAGAPQALLRLLHTLKGSARMAGAMRLGQHMHEMESRIEQVMHLSQQSPAILEDLLARHDHGLYMFDNLLNPAAAQAMPVSTVDGALPATSAGDLATATPAAAGLPANADGADPLTIGANRLLSGGLPDRRRAARQDAETLPAAAAPVPLVRVRADILDRLVNQAGEVSISRSRLENEVDSMRQSLGELTDNLARLREQLREVEMQAESQIANQTSARANMADGQFDPLEFDRFTRLQELTRMMAESVNDVGSVQQNLARTLDSAGDDLGIQARLTRELQQDLMSVRMVQFASITERLYRVTRQASKETDKRVNLDIHGSSVEIDRSVLEKMAGPFEHLLRNAIVHGIEARAARQAAGKNEVGELLVEVRQEGNEVVIEFSDDGQGLDLERIRSKAAETGLLAADGQIADAELKDLIFHPGFSTAAVVTELAGRGVGMDVVRSEATSLGGRVAIQSESGKGARFTVHLPLTLAVTQVVLLTTGGKTYAVPSVLVEQVQQLKAPALTAAYNEGAVMWQSQRVPMSYLASLLGEPSVTAVAQQYSPLLILKSGSNRTAIHVDEILGNREVVVKNIGPQLSRLTGIAGATVLGSGEIVLILNPVALAQQAQDLVRAPRLPDVSASDLGAVAEVGGDGVTRAVPGLHTQNIVMVVDDSLTVRRVTQRLLSREGYQVVLAKDGVDALEQLQSITPDVMLVDIEMPRMDGFDLTRNIRDDARTKHIPIIMITSRTASKHRNFAFELGVNEYLGKPYQEEQLLASLAGFISKAAPVG